MYTDCTPFEIGRECSTQHHGMHRNDYSALAPGGASSDRIYRHGCCAATDMLSGQTLPGLFIDQHCTARAP